MSETPPNPYAWRWVAKINGQVVSKGGRRNRPAAQPMPPAARKK